MGTVFYNSNRLTTMTISTIRAKMMGLFLLCKANGEKQKRSPSGSANTRKREA
jgi:hypothetical protein